MPNPRRTVAPTSEPVTLAEVKRHLRISHSADDPDIENILIPAARAAAELYCGKAWLTQTWVLQLDYFPCWEIELPRPPLASVSSITYLDTAGDAQTLSTSLYRVVTTRSPGLVEPAYGQAWPATYPVKHAVTITYVAGVASVSSLPDLLKPALLQMIAHWWRHREAYVTGTIVQKIPLNAADLLNKLRVGRYQGLYKIH